MQIPVPLGDVIDKITILRIKSERMQSPAKLANVRSELAALEARWTGAGHDLAMPEAVALKQVNEALWDVEDELRRMEASQDFGARFVELARSVYKTNDERARLKRAVNDALGSELVEEKDYVDYSEG